MEMGGVEPPSESVLTGTSPGADGSLHSLIPARAVTLRDPVASLCMVRAKLTARTFPTHRRSASGPWASRRERSLIKQREEQCYRCSLIYKVARFMAVRRRRPLFLPPHPRRNRYIPASDRAHSTPQPSRDFVHARRLRIRFPGLLFQNKA